MLNVKIIFKNEFSVILLTIWTNEVNSRIIVAEKTREDKKKKKRRTTLVLNLEVGGDQWWGLTPDPCGEWLGSFSLVILYYLDLIKRGRQKVAHVHT